MQWFLPPKVLGEVEGRLDLIILRPVLIPPLLPEQALEFIFTWWGDDQSCRAILHPGNDEVKLIFDVCCDSLGFHRYIEDTGQLDVGVFITSDSEEKIITAAVQKIPLRYNLRKKTEWKNGEKIGSFSIGDLRLNLRGEYVTESNILNVCGEPCGSVVVFLLYTSMSASQIKDFIESSQTAEKESSCSSDSVISSNSPNKTNISQVKKIKNVELSPKFVSIDTSELGLASVITKTKDQNFNPSHQKGAPQKCTYTTTTLPSVTPLVHKSEECSSAVDINLQDYIPDRNFIITRLFSFVDSGAIQASDLPTLIQICQGRSPSIDLSIDQSHRNLSLLGDSEVFDNSALPFHDGVAQGQDGIPGRNPEDSELQQLKFSSGQLPSCSIKNLGSLSSKAVVKNVVFDNSKAPQIAENSVVDLKKCIRPCHTWNYNASSKFLPVQKTNFALGNETETSLLILKVGTVNLNLSETRFISTSPLSSDIITKGKLVRQRSKVCFLVQISLHFAREHAGKKMATFVSRQIENGVVLFNSNEILQLPFGSRDAELEGFMKVRVIRRKLGERLGTEIGTGIASLQDLFEIREKEALLPLWVPDEKMKKGTEQLAGSLRFSVVFALVDGKLCSKELGNIEIGEGSRKIYVGDGETIYPDSEQSSIPFDNNSLDLTVNNEQNCSPELTYGRGWWYQDHGECRSATEQERLFDNIIRDISSKNVYHCPDSLPLLQENFAQDSHSNISQRESNKENLYILSPSDDEPIRDNRISVSTCHTAKEKKILGKNSLSSIPNGTKGILSDNRNVKRELFSNSILLDGDNQGTVPSLSYRSNDTMPMADGKNLCKKYLYHSNDCDMNAAAFKHHETNIFSKDLPLRLEQSPADNVRHEASSSNYNSENEGSKTDNCPSASHDFHSPLYADVCSTHLTDQTPFQECQVKLGIIAGFNFPLLCSPESQRSFAPNTYVKVFLPGSDHETKVVQNSTSPQWDFHTELTLFAKDLLQMNHHLVLLVFHSREGVSRRRDDPAIGFATIDTQFLWTSFLTFSGLIPVMNKSGEICGEIKVSLVSASQSTKKETIKSCQESATQTSQVWTEPKEPHHPTSLSADWSQPGFCHCTLHADHFLENSKAESAVVHNQLPYQYEEEENHDIEPRFRDYYAYQQPSKEYDTISEKHKSSSSEDTGAISTQRGRIGCEMYIYNGAKSRGPVKKNFLKSSALDVPENNSLSGKQEYYQPSVDDTTFIISGDSESPYEELLKMSLNDAKITSVDHTNNAPSVQDRETVEVKAVVADDVHSSVFSTENRLSSQTEERGDVGMSDTSKVNSVMEALSWMNQIATQKLDSPCVSYIETGVPLKDASFDIWQKEKPREILSPILEVEPTRRRVRKCRIAANINMPKFDET